MGRRVSRTLPLGQVERFTYYADGQIKTRTDFNGRATVSAYDAAGRLTTRTPDAAFSGELAVTYTYTACGRRALDLTGFGGHQRRGRYGVDHGRREEAEAGTADLHGRVQG
jgi:YD repeat-containing protein